MATGAHGPVTGRFSIYRHGSVVLLVLSVALILTSFYFNQNIFSEVSQKNFLNFRQTNSNVEKGLLVVAARNLNPIGFSSDIALEQSKTLSKLILSS